MSAREDTPMWDEPERYELEESPAYHFNLHRRTFLQVFGGGIAVLWTLEPSAAQESGGGRRRSASGLPEEVGAWLHIDENGGIIVYTGKVEVGQNIRTSLAQAVADELRVPLDSVRMVMGDTDRVPYDRGTFGSRSTPVMAVQLRKAAATARELLLHLAAESWNVEPSTLAARDGVISHPDPKRVATFGELTKGKTLTRTIGEESPTTPAEEWTIAGRSVPKVDGRDFLTGKHRFASDISRPGMWYGRVLRASSFGASLVSLDTSKAEEMKDVVVVRDGDFIGVAASSSGLASEALDAIRAEWKAKPQPSSEEIYDYFKANLRQGEGFRGPRHYNEGSMEDGLHNASETLTERYTIAYIAHAPMEPRAAVAEWQDRKLTVWTGTQRPFGVRDELMEVFHLPEDKVRVLMPDTGSGYGGKHTGECAIEAARLAKAAGRPVQLLWTREEEFAWAYFRPGGVIEVKSGVTQEGKITAWEFHNYNSGASAIQTRYELPNYHIAYHPAESPFRTGSYRGLAATANHFARECHIDGLAHAVGMEPLAFRLANTNDERFAAVLQAAARRFGWGKRKPATDHGFGIAGGFEKGSYVANCVEVSIDRKTGKVTIERIVTAFECGAIVHPDGLKHQVEGSVIMGLGGALFEAVEFADGKILNPRFSQYRVPRFRDVPVLETVLLDRKDLPSEGAGETPIVGVAPAIRNAIFHATGIRLRSLPMVPDGLPQEKLA